MLLQLQLESDSRCPSSAGFVSFYLTGNREICLPRCNRSGGVSHLCSTCFKTLHGAILDVSLCQIAAIYTADSNRIILPFAGCSVATYKIAVWALSFLQVSRAYFPVTSVVILLIGAYWSLLPPAGTKWLFDWNASDVLWPGRAVNGQEVRRGKRPRWIDCEGAWRFSSNMLGWSWTLLLHAAIW